MITIHEDDLRAAIQTAVKEAIKEELGERVRSMMDDVVAEQRGVMREGLRDAVELTFRSDGFKEAVKMATLSGIGSKFRNVIQQALLTVGRRLCDEPSLRDKLLPLVEDAVKSEPR